MRGLNLIAVFDNKTDKVLMCRRRKDPYKGLLNFVGGKIEENETGIDAAYRELFEETRINKEDIKLYHLMDFTYHFQDFYMEVYVGKLKREIEVFGEENELCWQDLDMDFADKNIFAGNGNLGHIMNILKYYKENR